MLWDIFCKVIDNHGDVGVCWRLSVQLAARGEQVRLWVDDPSALRWMAPGGDPRVQVRPWQDSAGDASQADPGDVIVEAFGCELSPAFQAAMAARAQAAGRQPAWINLEYLTAESFAQRSHGLPSPVLSGPAAGLTKHFFYPGFEPGTGGLLRERDLPERQAGFDPAQWLGRHGIDPVDGERRISLFCYEPPGLAPMLRHWAAGPHRTRLLVTAGRAAEAVRAACRFNDRASPAWNGPGRLSIAWLPLLSQPDFDHLLWASHLNFVRGEDSLVRALWAGKPLVWHIYPQHDGAHLAKLSAFLDWLGAPASLRRFHQAWNEPGHEPPEPGLAEWAACIHAARQRLLAQDDLATQLLRFAARRRKA